MNASVFFKVESLYTKSYGLNFGELHQDKTLFSKVIFFVMQFVTSAIPNLKFPTPRRSMILLFFQTVHEFSTNKRMSDHKFEHS